MNWVKQKATKSEESYFNKHISYTPLGDGYYAFVVREGVPGDCEQCDINDLRTIDTLRRSSNYRPFPLVLEEKQRTIESEMEKQETVEEFKKLKEDLANVFKQ